MGGLARKVARGVMHASAREARKRSRLVRAEIDKLSPQQRETVRVWAHRNPGRAITPNMVFAIATGLMT